MSVIDMIEDRRITIDEALLAVSEQSDRPIHDGIIQWTSHAARGYLRAFPDDPEQPMRSVRNRWAYRRQLSAPDQRGALRYEINVWGRCYVSVDGGTRELRLITNRVNARTRADAEIAVAAFVVAHGNPDPALQRVRIVQFGLLEGVTETLFDAGVDAVDEIYRRHGQRALAAIVDGADYRPGAVCADCPYTGSCPALQRAPGLLGLTDRTRPRRSWSATNARSYRACPAREHLRQQRLPVDAAVERNAAAERGRAVHAFLEQRHALAAGGPCVQLIPADWVPGSFDLAESDRLIGVRLLRHHAEVCPLRHATAVQIEPDLVFDDTDADVVVLAKPDLLYREREGWVWREVKTSASNQLRSGDVFVDYPQLAVGVMLIARGALGPGRGRIELEVLRPDGVDLTMLDPFTDGVRERAERILRDLVRAWHADDLFIAAPGEQCGRCEVSRWCSAKAGAVT